MPRGTILSPACQIAPKALNALERASVDLILGEGAFAEMGHLDAAQVFADARGYATAMLEGLTGSGAGLEGGDGASFVSLEILLPDKLFLGQVLALRDLLRVGGALVEPEASGAVPLGALVDGARRLFVARARLWQGGPGRQDGPFRVTKGDLEVLYPQAAVPPDALPPHPDDAPDLFALFVALPLLGPFLAKEEDCYVAPRVE